jgi:hypothetical protein
LSPRAGLNNVGKRNMPASVGIPTTTPQSSRWYPRYSLSHIRSLRAPTFMGTIRNAYKSVVKELSDLDVKGMKTAVK